MTKILLVQYTYLEVQILSQLPAVVSDRLAALIAQQELARKPFPLWALLALYEIGHGRDLYCAHFEGFKALRDWLAPIELPTLPPDYKSPLHKLNRGYELQEIARLLNTSMEITYYGYKTTVAKLFQSTDSTQLPP